MRPAVGPLERALTSKASVATCARALRVAWRAPPPPKVLSVQRATGHGRPEQQAGRQGGRYLSFAVTEVHWLPVAESFSGPSPLKASTVAPS